MYVKFFLFSYPSGDHTTSNSWKHNYGQTFDQMLVDSSLIELFL